LGTQIPVSYWLAGIYYFRYKDRCKQYLEEFSSYSLNSLYQNSIINCI